jgi:hypothetical protein
MLIQYTSLTTQIAGIIMFVLVPISLIELFLNLNTNNSVRIFVVDRPYTGNIFHSKLDRYFVFLMMKKIRGVFRFLIFLLLSLIIFSFCRYIVQLFTDNNFLLILIPVTVLTFFALAKEYVYSLIDMMMNWTTDHPE